MSVNIVGEVKGGVEAELNFPPCPKCGEKGMFLRQTFDVVDGFFAIVDVYACPVCQPEVIAAQQSVQRTGDLHISKHGKALHDKHVRHTRR